MSFYTTLTLHHLHQSGKGNQNLASKIDIIVHLKKGKVSRVSTSAPKHARTPARLPLPSTHNPVATAAGGGWCVYSTRIFILQGFLKGMFLCSSLFVYIWYVGSPVIYRCRFYTFFLTIKQRR